LFSIDFLPGNIPSSDSNNDGPAGYGSACLANNDCRNVTADLECLHGTCVCLDGYVPLGKYLCYNIRTQGNRFYDTYTMIRIFFKVHRL
jgi:hypothetical protein